MGFDTVLAMKVAVTCVIGVLAVLQLLGRWALQTARRRGAVLAGHRAPSGRHGRPAAHRLRRVSLPLGAWLESGHLPDGEGAADGRARGPGCAVFRGGRGEGDGGAVPRGPWLVLPIAGGLLFALLVLVVLTSAVWYLDAHGWPSNSYA